MTLLKRKTRIAFIAHDCSLFGAQRSLLSLLLTIDRNKFDPVVIIPYEGPFADLVRQANIPCHVAAMSRWIPVAAERKSSYVKDFLRSTPNRIRSLLRLLVSLHIDIVYTNTIVNIDGALAAKLIGKKHIWHLRESVRDNKQLSPFFPICLTPYIVKFLSNRVIVNSKWLGMQYFGNNSVAAVVYNGIDEKVFGHVDDRHPPLREELGIPEDSQLIVSIGSMDARKRHDIFIKTAKILCSHSDNVYALIVGGGDDDYENYLKSLIENENLQGRILLLGWRNDVSRIIASCDVLILSSDQEPFGRVLIEGMALKKPVVATRSGGPEEIIIDGETGYLVPIRNPVEIADHVVKLLNDQQLCLTMGEAGNKRVANIFSEQTYVASLEKIISEVTASIYE